ncbi:MAG: sigma-70 family RNA polymerase sigma factor [Planctomycetales bacterium]|nr:sigma-70 family RNA polymerase sigma factor [Planctomycetales bacterium]
MADHGLTLAEIYDAHFEFVWRVLRRLGVPNQDVRDALQDVFVVVHRKLPEFRGESKVTTWLFGICLRVASDRRRSAHARREIATGTDLGAELPDVGAASDIERRDAIRLLERILDEMPEEQRVVFTLFELEEHSCEAIAELVGVPLGTVYSRLRLARKVFKRGLARRQAREQFSIGAARGEAS